MRSHLSHIDRLEKTTSLVVQVVELAKAGNNSQLPKQFPPPSIKLEKVSVAPALLLAFSALVCMRVSHGLCWRSHSTNLNIRAVNKPWAISVAMFIHVVWHPPTHIHTHAHTHRHRIKAHTELANQADHRWTSLCEAVGLWATGFNCCPKSNTSVRWH